MRDLAAAVEEPALLEVGDDFGVRVLDEPSGPRRHLAREVPRLVDRLEQREPLGLAGVVVVLAERGGHVHDAGAVLERDEIGADDAEGARRVLEEREARLVALADELAPLDRAEDLLVAVEHAGERLGEYERLPLVSDAHVVVLRPHREGDVRNERPRCRRPHEEIRVLSLDLELDVDRGVLRVGVPLRDLVARKRRAASRAVRDDLVALIEHVLIPELPEDPPDRLDVLVLEGDVRIVEIEPEAELARELVPLVEVGPHALAALLVERGDAVALDLILAVETELVLDLDLDRQAVRVPAGLADDAVAAHRPVAADEVLDRAREGVVHAGTAVRRRRPLVEDEGVVRGPLLDAPPEDAVRFPVGEDLFLDLDRLAERRKLRVALSRFLSISHRRARRSLRARRSRRRKRVQDRHPPPGAGI